MNYKKFEEEIEKLGKRIDTVNNLTDEDVELNPKLDIALDISFLAADCAVYYGVSKIVRCAVDAATPTAAKPITRFLFKTSGVAVSYVIGDAISGKLTNVKDFTKQMIKVGKVVKKIKEEENGSEPESIEPERY